MSRSRRRPYYVDGQSRGTKWAKRLAHHRWRQATRAALIHGEEPPARPEEASNPYDIHDWSWYTPGDPAAHRK